jgi:hypothetical protein
MTAVAQAPARRKAATPADAVRAAEDELAAKRQELESAVAAGDVERVLELRSFTEVKGPRAVAAAMLAKIDADIEELESAIESGELQRQEDVADAVLDTARQALREVQQAVIEANRAGNEALLVRNVASKARLTAARRLGDLQETRAQLIERSEAEISARIRAIAGLEPETEPDGPAPTTNMSPRVSDFADAKGRPF